MTGPCCRSMTGGMEPLAPDYREHLVSRATRYLYDYDNYEGGDDFDDVLMMLQACLESLGRTKAEGLRSLSKEGS